MSRSMEVDLRLTQYPAHSLQRIRAMESPVKPIIVTTPENVPSPAISKVFKQFLEHVNEYIVSRNEILINLFMADPMVKW